jgi:hypothetical protein
MLMIFQAQKNWEVATPVELFGSDSRHFRMIHRAMNVGIFLVDLEIIHEDYGEINNRIEQFFLGDAFDTLNFISNSEFESVKIAYLCPRSKNKGNLSVSDVTKISSALDDCDQNAYIIQCKDNQTHIISCLADSVDGLKNIQTEYLDKSLTQ